MGSDSGLDHTAPEDPSPADGTTSPDAEPTMPVAWVARRLGVAPSTLRTWDRRYGLGPSRHTGGRHRRYRASDINRLELMQRALLQGASTAEAARYALDRAPKNLVSQPATTAEVSARAAFLDRDGVDQQEDRKAADFEVDGYAPPLLARRLSQAALAMDVSTVQLVLAKTITEAGAFSAWQAVIQPVLAALANHDDRIGKPVEAEYLLSECVVAALTRATQVAPEPLNARSVFLACAPGERDHYPLSLYAIAASLNERGIGSQTFGRALPASVLSAIVRRGTPASLLLLSSRQASADADLFEIPRQSRPRSRFFAFGEGWAGTQLPPTVEWLPDFVTAIERLARVLVGAKARGLKIH